jgi:hypothetical protein
VDEGSAADAEILMAARWAEGCRRYEAIRRLLEDHKPRPSKSAMSDTAWELGVSRATLYRLVDIYKSAGTVEALQPIAMGRRAGTWVLPKKAEEIIERAIREVYLKPTRPTLTHLVSRVHERCSEEGIALPDRRTVRARVKAIDIRVRGQRRGEEDVVKSTKAVPGEYSVSRPLEVVQIDHTEIDIIVVTRRRMLDHVGILPLSVEALDREITLGQQIMLAGYFRRQPCEIAAMSYETVRSSMCTLIRSSAPQQSCQACAEKGERGDAKGAIGKSWMQGWRITCRVCGGGLTDDDDPQMAQASAERFSDYWDLALDGESLFEIYASAVDETGTSPLSIAILLCLPRWPGPGELSDGYRISRLLNIVVSGVDDFAHRMGLSRAMSRGLFLPVSLRIPLLAGVAIATRDPRAILPSLYDHALPRARQRFTKVGEALHKTMAGQSQIDS